MSQIPPMDALFTLPYTHTHTHTIISRWFCVIAGSITVLFLQDHLASEANALTATPSLGHYHLPALSLSPFLALSLSLWIFICPSLSVAPLLLPSLSLVVLSILYIIRTVPLWPFSSFSASFSCHTFPLMLIIYVLIALHPHSAFFSNMMCTLLKIH